MSYLADIKSVEKLNHLIEVCRANLYSVDEELIRRAFEFSWNAHVKGKPRASGEPYFSHPYEVGLVVAKEIPLDDISVAAALLHDVVEDTPYDLKAIRAEFGSEIAEIVDGVTKISGVVESHDITRAENYRKMLLSMAKDVRVILVKFADRLHNMRTLAFLPPDKQERIAKETLEIYAPLAHRFGLAKVKWEFEDLAFKHINSSDYEYISRKLNAKRREREAYIRKFIQPIRKRLEGEEFRFDITGRPKHIYSIYNKMVKRGKPIEEIYDLFAVRVILDTEDKNECFSVYGIVSEIYTPVPERFKDYISVPKQNGYQSIHTTVVGPEGKMVEVQIRTRPMDEIAERGVAAHWKYKEDIKVTDKNLEEWISWVREILEQPPAAASEDAATTFLESFKLDLYQDEIYVFTPKGELQILPRGSTPVDFAFEIHSEIGTHCVGAKINGRIVPLNTKLNSGDQIEIITSSNQNVNPDWEKFVVSRKAKAHIRRWVNEETRKKAAEGEEIWEKRLKKHKLTVPEEDFAKLLRDMKFDNVQKFFVAIADEEVEPDRMIARLTQQQKSVREGAEVGKPLHSFVEIARKASDGIVVDGSRTDLKFSYAKCCSPIPGDEIVGFVTTGEGIKLHRKNCANLSRLEGAAKERIVEATWPGENSGLFVAGVAVSGMDRPGILTELTHAVSSYQNTNIRSVSAEVRSAIFECQIIIYVRDKEHLERLIDKLRKIEGVTHVDRMSAGTAGLGQNA